MSAAHPTVRYCYAIARPFPEEVLRGLAGVRDAELRPVREGDLVAVTSPVPAADFDESALRRNLEDLDWLAGVARAHSAVVDAVAERAATLPLRLATVYLDEDRVRAVLRGGRARFAAALDRITGRVEWGVKVSTLPADRGGRPRADRSGTGHADASGRSGRSYLRRRMAERNARETGWRRAAEAADRIDRELSELAEDRRQYRPQSTRLTGSRGENVLNVAYLVAEERSAAFVDRFAALRDAADGYQVELTGPWAPYSFAEQTEDTDDAGRAGQAGAEPVTANGSPHGEVS
ncbi:GvpL/GvpF family gas vesicle protein [Gandjariella thermophila]|uniref:Gas vesicle protein n=1 Tax=Gandjariella thermophila TaxID=1931992 RepID=A0A4D4JAE1_9PSEU|nr:GvpL/GvpF family gas vesicle protein [Gandjariella thermophila]GDY32534.1 gas vesicle protein [Gandjariella thermophila]